MRSALGDNDVFIIHLIDDAVFAVDAAAPPSAVLMAQRLRFADAVKGASADIRNQCIDFLQGLFILHLPVNVILPAFRKKQDVQHITPPWLSAGQRIRISHRRNHSHKLRWLYSSGSGWQRNRMGQTVAE